MKITAIEDLHCDAGWRNFSFLKISTDDGLTGWSEYCESFGSQGLTHVIRRLGGALLGRDPRRVSRIGSDLSRMTRTAPGGVNQQAIAAIEHALLDISGKALGAPVSALFGGRYRDRIPLYWSHCGTFRVDHAAMIGCSPIRSLDDLRTLGREVAERGYTALKTNLIRFDQDRVWIQGLDQRRDDGSRHPEANLDRAILDAIDAQLAALRAGAGPAMGLMLDVNFFFKPESFLRIGRAIVRHDLTWLECDSLDAGALAHVRNNVAVPVASGEALYGREALLPFFEKRALDVAVVDVIWNGMIESIRIAAVAEAYQVNVAPHNFFGPLADAISAHFSAMVPNLRIMEQDVDSVPWHDDLLIPRPQIVDGCYVLPDGPGWGADVDESVVAAHPPRGAGYAPFTGAGGEP